MEKNIVSLRKEIIEVGKRAYTRGYAASNDGNISARLDKKQVLITPSGVSKGFIKTSDLIVIDMNGKAAGFGKKPSSETFMHLQIYKIREDVNGICHFHPPYATGFAVAGTAIDDNVLSEAVITLGKIPLVDYGTPGTEELFGKLTPHIQNYDAFLLANHGALTFGESVLDAYNKMETLEHTAQIIFIAKQLGNINILSAEQIQKLFALRGKFGIREKT